MTIYTVHSRASLPQADPIGVVFVKEGFCWPALFIPLFWLLFRRMWLGLLIYILAGAALVYLDQFVSSRATGIVGFLFAVLFAFEANYLRTRKLAHAGYRMVGVAEGRGRLDAETRFFTALPQTLTISSAPPTPPPPTVTRVPTDSPNPPVVGLFPSPGGRT